MFSLAQTHFAAFPQLWNNIPTKPNKEVNKYKVQNLINMATLPAVITGLVGLPNRSVQEKGKEKKKTKI